ncbi:MAG: hypothetical protein ACHQT8_00045 [Chlamydiales bacterium]
MRLIFFLLSFAFLTRTYPINISNESSGDLSVFIFYNPYEQTLLHQGKFFSLLPPGSGEFPSTRFVSIGETPFRREIISLDPSTSETLEKKYALLLSKILSECSTYEEIFTLTAGFVRREVFSPPLSNEQNINDFLQDWIHANARRRDAFTLTDQNQLWPVIPLEDFVKAKTGICRHLALVVGYFLDKLQGEESCRSILPRGKTYFLRNEVTLRPEISHHAWNLFLSDDRSIIWHIDSTVGIIKDVRKEGLAIARIYGPKALEQEKQRLLRSNDES